MTLSWRYAVASDTGLLREGNEDAAYAGAHLIAVADGMGGHAAGEVASATAIAALEPLDHTADGNPSSALHHAIAHANESIRTLVAGDGELEGMGTTVTAALADGDDVWLAHIGDSRAYLFRDGRLRQLTHDHTFVQQLVDEGRIAPEDVSTHPQRNLITKVLDGRDSMQLDYERLDLVPGDRLLLCSDGLSAVVSDATVADVLAGSSPDDAVHRLVDLALRAGGPDNVTCIVADLVGEHTTSAVEADELDPRRRARQLRKRRTVIVSILVLVLFAVGGTGAYAWTQRQYYVGVSGDNVAIYQGVEGSLAWIDLSHAQETYPLLVGDLPDYERKRVRDGIHATGLGDARRIVERLRATVATP